MRKMKESGTQIITVDSDIDREKFRDVRTAFIGTNNLQAGQELGKCAKNLLPGGGEYVAFVGRTGAQNAIERINGFGEGAGPAFKKLDVMPDDTDRSRARENVRTAYRNNPKISTLVGIWSYNAPAIVDVVKQLKIRDQVKIVAFDAEPQAIKAMGDGYLDAMVVQNPWQMGYSSVDLMLALVHPPAKLRMPLLLPKLGQPEGDILDTGTKVVVPDSGSPLKKEMFDPSTQYMKLDEFKTWLKAHNLTES
jgi:ribose transport system substrate-binding protein